MSSRSTLLLYYPPMAALASKVAELCTVRRESMGDAHREEYRMCEKMDLIKWERFPDGFPNIFIENVKEVAGRDVIFLSSMEDCSTIFEQMALMYALPRYLVKSLTILLPYFPTGTMERVDHEGQIATAKTLAIQLSAIPLCRDGPTQIVIVDIHALQERFYFGSLVVPRLASGIPLLLDRLAAAFEHEMDSIAIAFPDDGASKRFSQYFAAHHHIVVCSKVRQGDRRVITIKEGDPAGRHVVVVDDLVQTGGTLIECAKALRAANCLSTSAYVTHAVFPNKAYEKITPELFRYFWHTDSCPNTAEVLKGRAPFELVSLAPAIVELLHDFNLRV